MEEMWKSIKGFEGLYEVSNLGRIKALDRYVQNNGGIQHRTQKILKAYGGNNKHLTVVLCKNGKTYPRLVHRLVASAFIPNPDNKPVVDHIDTVPTNNCVNNLRWVTAKENANNPLSRIHNSESKKGHKCYLTKHSEETKKKLSDAHKGKTLSKEHRMKLSEAHKGEVWTKERRNKLSKSTTGHKVSEETREKIREKLKGVHKGKHWKIEKGKRVWY